MSLSNKRLAETKYVSCLCGDQIMCEKVIGGSNSLYAQWIGKCERCFMVLGVWIAQVESQ